MNFEEIKKKYPKAFKKFRNYELLGSSFFCEDLTDRKDLMWRWRNKLLINYHDRDLYDFFDKQDIIVQTAKLLTTNKIKWGWVISVVYRLTEDDIDSNAYYSERYSYTSRIEAEEEAFMKAFELLEDK